MKPLLLLVLIVLAGCQSRHECVVTPNDTVECHEGRIVPLAGER